MGTIKQSGQIISMVYLSVLLVACGGGSGGDDDSTDRQTGQARTLSGQVTGLQGQLQLNTNGEIVTIDEAGDFQLPNSFEDGDEISLSLEQVPFRQTCEITSDTQLTIDGADIDNVAIQCDPLGSLTGSVQNYFTAVPITGVEVSVRAQSGDEWMDVATVQTDEQGNYEVEGLGISDRFIVTAGGDGFGSSFEVFSNSQSQVDVDLNTMLLQAQLDGDFDPSMPNEFRIDGVLVLSLPANSLVDASGNPVTEPFTSTITIIDPSRDEALMPGEFETLNPDNGEVNQIESFGAMEIVFRNEAGEQLDLAAGSTATLSIPLAEGASNPPASIPLFYFDTQTGFWVEEGEATLEQQDGARVYTGTVSQFQGVWNADRVLETVDIIGCVQDDEGERLANAEVTAVGSTYIGSSKTRTDADGNFAVPARVNSDVFVFSRQGSESETVELELNDNDHTIEHCLVLAPSAATIKLTWGENPSDLDSHLFGPQEDGDGEFHLSYQDKQLVVAETLIDLDVDDTNSFGPEIVNIPRFPLPGTYRYAVKHYSGSSDIQASPARVELNLGGETQVFSPVAANGDPDDIWHVFDLIVAEGGEVTVETVQTFSDSLDRESPNVAPVSPAAAPSQPMGAFQSKVKAKYYAE